MKIKKHLNLNFKEITQIAQKSIEIQRQTISDLSASINEDFLAAIEYIYNNVDRIIITGIGKSALIAKKIAATLNSTGTSAIYMHASDAVHGDLGVINKNDIIICISKSGETAELKVLVNQVKKFGNKIIAFASNKNSFLAKQCDFLLFIPVKKEADPNNLAPTSSTTAQLVMGDTIAISLLALRGFKPEHFALFHPSGSLGNQLYLKVSDIYPKNEKPTVKLGDEMHHVIYEMTSKRLGVTAVEDNNKLVGIITDGDLRRVLKSHKNVFELQARDIMTINPKTISYESYAVDAFSLMKKHNITQLIVCDENKYLGIIHLHDLLNAGLI